MHGALIGDFEHTRTLILIQISFNLYVTRENVNSVARTAVDAVLSMLLFICSLLFGSFLCECALHFACFRLYCARAAVRRGPFSIWLIRLRLDTKFGKSNNHNCR